MYICQCGIGKGKGCKGNAEIPCKEDLIFSPIISSPCILVTLKFGQKGFEKASNLPTLTREQDYPILPGLWSGMPERVSKRNGVVSQGVMYVHKVANIFTLQPELGRLTRYQRCGEHRGLQPVSSEAKLQQRTKGGIHFSHAWPCPAAASAKCSFRILLQALAAFWQS